MCEETKMQLSVKTETKICVVRQLMQSVNCALARRLKNVLVDQTRDVAVHQVKPAVSGHK